MNAPPEAPPRGCATLVVVATTVVLLFLLYPVFSRLGVPWLSLVILGVMAFVIQAIRDNRG